MKLLLVAVACLGLPEGGGAFVTRSPAAAAARTTVDDRQQTSSLFLQIRSNEQATTVSPTTTSSSTSTSPAPWTRETFLKTIASTAGAASVILATPLPAEARGRATLEQAYDRYTPRVTAGGKFYANDLKSMIAKGDWAGVKAATSDPPKKTKEDRVKQDGGVAERAAQAGGFSDARVLVAADLFAGTFSDNSISQKTKTMKDQVEGMRKTVQSLNLTARQALGEVKAEGGLFGIGGKTPSKAELSQTIKQLYIDGELS
jgi:hypothetical protein